MTPLCRSATAADVAAMARLRAQSWGEEAYWRERIRAYLAGTQHPQMALAERAAWVACEGTECIGLIAGHLTRRFGCAGELEWIDTDAAHRRRGVATMLLQVLAGWFVGHEARRVCVNAAEDNPAARAFYARHGAASLRPHWMVWEDISRARARA